MRIQGSGFGSMLDARYQHVVVHAVEEFLEVQVHYSAVAVVCRSPRSKTASCVPRPGLNLKCAGN